MSAVVRYFILILNQVEIASTHKISDPDGTHAIPVDPEDGEWIEVSESDLGSQTVEEFAATHKPVYAGSSPVFDSWSARATSLVVTQSIPLAYSGGTAQIFLTLGVSSSNFTVEISGGILCSITEGALDGSGEANFYIKNVSATSGYLRVRPHGHSDFEVVEHTVEYETWSP